MNSARLAALLRRQARLHEDQAKVLDAIADELAGGASPAPAPPAPLPPRRPKRPPYVPDGPVNDVDRRLARGAFELRDHEVSRVGRR
jgi:hypothetical protein